MCGNETVGWEDGLLMPSRRQVSCGKMGEMGIRNLPGQLLKPTKLELPLQLGSHTHNRAPPANVLITWNFDDPNDSHADDMVQAYRYGPNQSSKRGTDQEPGRRDVKETFLAFFSESGWISSSSSSCIFMPAPPVSGFPKFIRSRRCGDVHF